MAEFALIILLAVVAIGLAYRYLRRRAGQMSQLISRGTEVTGQVTDVRRVRRSRTHEACIVRYAFVTTGGVRYEREIEVMPREFDNYRQDQDIEVVYDPADPTNNMLSHAVDAARTASTRQRMSHSGE